MSELTIIRDRNQPVLPLAEESADGTPIGALIEQGIRVLRRRKLAAVVALVVFTLPAALFVVRRPPIYQSTARLLVERNSEIAAVVRDSAEGTAPVDNFFQTQAELLRSRPTIIKAIQTIRLWDAPEFRTPIAGTVDDVSRSGLVERYLERLTVASMPGTHLLNVTFRASDPTLAADAVNALTAAYIQDQAAAHGADASQVRRWIDERLAEQQQRLKDSEAALQTYLATHDAVSVEDRQNIVVQKLSDLNTALTKAKTERMAREALYRQLEAARDNPGALDALPVVLSNSVLQMLRAQLADLRQKQTAMSQDLGERHPEMIKLQSQIDATAARLDAEIAKVTESVRNDYDAALAIEQDLTNALSSQKEQVVDLHQKSLDYGSLQRQVSIDRQIYERLLTESQTRDVVDQTNDHVIRVIEPANAPIAPIGPHNWRDLGLVAFAGLMLALAVPLGLEAFDRRIKGPADIAQHLKIPCLALVPLIRNSQRQGSAPRPLMTSSSNAYNEAFRRIRAAVRPPTGRRPMACRLLVTSALPDEGKSLVAANLAIALARSGQRVLLMDADLRRPAVHANFDMPPEPGLTNLLQRESHAQSALRGTSIPNLFVLTSGTPHADGAELLSSPNLQSLLSVVESRFSFVIFDSPPVGPVADACILARAAEHTIFVVSADMTPISAAVTALDQLRAAGATITGAVFNRADLEHLGYYYGSYHHATYATYRQDVSIADGTTDAPVA